VGSYLKETSDGIVIQLHVIPNASKTEIVGTHGEALKIKIKAPPVDGKANQAIVSFFSEFLNVAKSKIEILRGDKSKTKSLLIRGIGLTELKGRFSETAK
jgi:uncharacterized protein (TIGR00251 family)